LGALSARYSVAHEKIIRAGFTDRQIQDAVLGELEPHLDGIPWAELPKSRRKREWIRLCLLVVKRLDRLLVELKEQRRAHGPLFHSSDTAGSLLDHVPAPTERKADSHMDKLREMKKNGKSRADRLSMRARLDHIVPSVECKGDNSVIDLEAKKGTRSNPARRVSMQATKVAEFPSASMAAPHKRRYPGDHSEIAKKRPVSRPPHWQPLVRKRTPQQVPKTLGAGNRPFHPLYMRSNDDVDREHAAKVTERTQQHINRQELRSKQRMRLFSMREAWLRQSQEKASIGDDLWQNSQEDQHSAPRKDDMWAWPRLAQRQRDLLADEVEAFVRGRQ
jgi:hypothetical protein